MTDEQKAKIEAAAIQHHDENCEGYGVGPRTSFEMGATFGLSLANEPVGDDEKDAIEQCPNDLHYRKECDDSMFKCGANLSWREGFVQGRAGMVPATELQKYQNSSVAWMEQCKHHAEEIRILNENIEVLKTTSKALAATAVEDAVRAERERITDEFREIDYNKSGDWKSVSEVISAFQEILTPTNQGEKE